MESVAVVPHRIAKDAHDIDVFENYYVGEEYEGVMIRDPNGRYKYGRSTVKEGGLLKLKRWHDDEATTDELGRTKRSSHKENKTGRGDMGALVCCMRKSGAIFEIGTGFTDAQRAELWNDAAICGKLVTFKYQQLSPDGVPRFPVFKGFRNDGHE